MMRIIKKMKSFLREFEKHNGSKNVKKENKGATGRKMLPQQCYEIKHDRRFGEIE